MRSTSARISSERQGLIESAPYAHLLGSAVQGVTREPTSEMRVARADAGLRRMRRSNNVSDAKK